MKKKSTLIIALLVCLIAILSVGTLAYFTAKDSVTNTFMTASYDPENPDKPVDPTTLFSIDVYETNEQDEKVAALTYSNVKPGDQLDKDPTVQNTGKYDQWVRAKVTFSNANEWKAALGTTGVNTILTLSNGWTIDTAAAVEDATANTITYTYYLDSKLTPNSTATLFTKVNIPTSLTVEQMAALAKFTITIGADAIQADHTGDTAQAAFAANWSEPTT